MFRQVLIYSWVVYGLWNALTGYRRCGLAATACQRTTSVSQREARTYLDELMDREALGYGAAFRCATGYERETTSARRTWQRGRWQKQTKSGPCTSVGRVLKATADIQCPPRGYLI